jgi:hypothetical protein
VVAAGGKETVMEGQYCHSCGVPLDMPDMKGMAEEHCKHCTDDNGKLKSKEEVRQGIAWWLKSWQPGIDDATAMKRAEQYMKAMPEWAE